MSTYHISFQTPENDQNILISRLIMILISLKELISQCITSYRSYMFNIFSCYNKDKVRVLCPIQGHMLSSAKHCPLCESSPCRGDRLSLDAKLANH